MTEARELFRTEFLDDFALPRCTMSVLIDADRGASRARNECESESTSRQRVATNRAPRAA